VRNAPSKQQLSDMAKTVRQSVKDAEKLIEAMRPHMIGARYMYSGHLYQIRALHLAHGGHISGYGVRINKAGRIGTRDFFIMIDPKNLVEE